MSAMSEIATELDVHWKLADVGLYWKRKLPFGQLAVISSGSFGYTLTIDRNKVDVYETLPEALAVAGEIAVGQLNVQASTWTTER